MSDIFVSYASEDRERIMPLVRILENTGWSVFWDRTIPAGKTWREVIGGEIQSARSVVVVWTETSVKSRWVQEEAEAGVKRGILIPILLHPVDPPFGFGSVHAADLSGWDGDDSAAAVVRLLRDISAILGPNPAVTDAERSRRNEEEARRAAAEERAREQEQQQAEEESRRKKEAAEDAERRRIEKRWRFSGLWQKRYIVPAVLILLALTGVAVYRWMTIGPSKDEVRIADLLRRARVAERESRLTPPPEDSAVTYYRKVLQLDPDNVAAQKGLDQIAEKFLGVAQRALAKRSFDEAAKNLEWAASVNPDHPAVAELQRELEELRKQETDRTREEAERKREESGQITEKYLGLARRALAEQHFDEAARHLDKAASVNPEHPMIPRLRQQLEKLQARDPGAIVIRSHLAEVNVFINDKPVGRTSYEGELGVENLKPGRYHIVGRKAGFDPWEREVVVRPGEPSSVLIEMRPRFRERVLEAEFPQQPSGKIPFVDIDRGRQVEFSDQGADFSFKDDGTGNFVATPIFISAHNGARICRIVPAPENPWQCEEDAYVKGTRVRQGQWVSCITSRRNYCRMNIEMKGPTLLVRLWLYELRFGEP